MDKRHKRQSSHSMLVCWVTHMPVCLILMLGCKAVDESEHRAMASAAQDTLEAFTGAVLPVETGPVLTRPCTRRGPDGVIGYFSPTAAEIEALESRLPRALERARSSNSAAPPAANYYRQYIGIIRSGDEKIIYVNAFPRAHIIQMNALVRQLPQEGGARLDSVAWRRHPVSVCDGGRLYWSVEYDPRTHVFRRFEMNQSA